MKIIMLWKIYFWFIIIFVFLGYLFGEIRGLIGVFDLLFSSVFLYIYTLFVSEAQMIMILKGKY